MSHFFKPTGLRSKTAGSGVLGVVMALCIAVAAAVFIGAIVRSFGIPKATPAVTPAPAVQWLGSPVIAQEHATGHLTNVEFGIRDDGVVIWRDKRGPAVDGIRFGAFPMPPAPFTPMAPFIETPK